MNYALSMFLCIFITCKYSIRQRFVSENSTHMVYIRITEQRVWQRIPTFLMRKKRVAAEWFATLCRRSHVCLACWHVVSFKKLPLKAAVPFTNVPGRKCNLRQFLNITDPLPAWQLPLKIPVNLNLAWKTHGKRRKWADFG